MNFQIFGHGKAIASIQLITKSGPRVFQKKTHDVNELRQHLIDVGVGVKHSVDVSMHTFEPQEDILNIHGDTSVIMCATRLLIATSNLHYV